MKQLLLVFLSLLVVKAYSQEELVKSNNFEVSEYVYDFGHIKQEDGDVVHQFMFRNISDSTIKFDTLETECGCTVPSFGGVRKEVLPDSSVLILVVYEASTHPSYDSEDFYKTITVYTSVDTFQVAITGYVLPNLEMKDYENVRGKLLFQDYGFNFGNIYHDKVIEKRYKFYNMFEDSVWLEKVDTPSWIELSTEPKKVGHAERGELIVRYDPKKKNDWSFVKDYIKVKFSSMEEEINFVQSATILERFDINRDKSKDPVIRIDTLTYNIGSVTKGDTLTTSITVHNEGTSDLVLRKIDPTCSCVKLTEKNFVLTPNESKKVGVTFYTRKSRTGTQRKKVYFISNDPNNPIVTYNITGKTKLKK